MIANVGDRIIVQRADGRYDLFKIDDTGMRVRLRANLASRDAAADAVSAAVRLGARVWLCDERTLDITEPWST